MAAEGQQGARTSDELDRRLERLEKKIDKLDDRLFSIYRWILLIASTVTAIFIDHVFL